jgi:hypothetical protein
MAQVGSPKKGLLDLEGRCMDWITHIGVLGNDDKDSKYLGTLFVLLPVVKNTGNSITDPKKILAQVP